MKKLKQLYEECVRVLTVTKKPTKQEFWTTSRISALGILILGLIGFIMFVIKQYLTGGVL